LKKSIPIFLLSVLFCGSIIPYFLFLYQRSELRAFSEHYQDQEVRMAFSNNEDIAWERPGLEFWFKGQLYDVKKKISNPDSMIFFCGEDTGESQLVRSYTCVMSSNSGECIGDELLVLTYPSPIWPLTFERPESSLVSSPANTSFGFHRGYCSIFDPPPEHSLF
jgi:hypothetical protein